MRKCKEGTCFSDGVCRDGRCQKHTNGKRPKMDYNRRTKPNSSCPHLGIEIECFASSETAHDVMLAQCARPCRDGSLPNWGCEFKICRPAATAKRKAKNLVERLTAAGAVVNSKCGLHVHLDARGVSGQRKDEFLAWLMTWQEWWFGIMPPSRRNNDYARRITPYNHCEHRAWAHKSDYNTIEIRIHGGTLNPHKVGGWLAVCTDLMALLRDATRPLPAVNGETPDLASIFCPEALAYLTARRRANGTMITTSNTPNGPVTESESA